MLKDVEDFFSISIRMKIIEFIQENKDFEDKIEEIRLRINQKVCIKSRGKFIRIEHRVTQEEIIEIFENICEKSIYSHINQISEGFITVKGGNRVGIVGSCVIENGQVKNINYISSLNFRIANQIKDSSIPYLKYIIELENNTIFNTLLVSSPGGGKTTLLRDLTRNLSNRNFIH